MTESLQDRRAVRFCAALLGGTGLVFLVERLIQVSSQGAAILPLPIVQLVLDAGCAAVVLTGNRVLRPGVLVIAVLGALLQMVILLGGGPLWSFLVALVLAMAQVYALVLLNTKPIRVHFGLDTHDDPLDLEQ
ncbi:MAG TPA: hypothetical protein VF892_26240 [Pseudonocardiaceae bacterium]